MRLAGVVILVDQDRGIGHIFGTVQVNSVQVSNTSHGYTCVPITLLLQAADIPLAGLVGLSGGHKWLLSPAD
jgi:hypothetical protein